MARTKASEAERQKAIEQLREWLKPGDTVYTILRNVSKSGMSREIGVVLMVPDERRGLVDLHPNYLVAKAGDFRLGKRDGIIMGGCGMDMGFALVYSLSRTLFPDGFGIEGERIADDDGAPIQRRRPKTEAEAIEMRAEGFKFFGRNGDDTGWDSDGGYALRQRWL
jgi:hypothetical protein